MYRGLPKDELQPGLQSELMNTSYVALLLIKAFLVIVKLLAKT